MKTVQDPESLRAQVQAWRRAGEPVAFVPTMGSLHDGHLQLVHHARDLCSRAVVSVFVNPLQFGPGEDFDAYPRSLKADGALLAEAGADLLFAPDAATMYARSLPEHTRVEVPGLSDQLCGAVRPGHFAGVTTVVCKLFNQVQPDVAVFGEKDLQQLVLIRRMVEDLSMPLTVVGYPTVREADGLAMSSRNAYLTVEEREKAPLLYRALADAVARIRAGEAPAEAEAQVTGRLAQEGFRPDYVSVRRLPDLAVADAGDDRLAILAAAHLGRARLIDNLQFRR
ncbi:MAG: pantoate--beta-alanine ligase [Pseudomonadota bacterium]